jgi:hypothetical protein
MPRGTGMANYTITLRDKCDALFRLHPKSRPLVPFFCSEARRLPLTCDAVLVAAEIRV